MAQRVKTKSVSYDVVVVGGGLSGMCAAIAAARHGAKTALIHARHGLEEMPPAKSESISAALRKVWQNLTWRKVAFYTK